jgi:hypothetical protein
MIEKSFMSGMLYFLRRKSVHNYARVKIIQEINYNLRLIDMMEWNGVEEKFKLELCKNFKTEEIEFYIKFITTDLMNNLLNQKSESDEDGISESPYSSAINKMETLKALAKVNQNILEVNNKAKLNTRIKNIKTALTSIKSTILESK